MDLIVIWVCPYLIKNSAIEYKVFFLIQVNLEYFQYFEKRLGINFFLNILKIFNVAALDVKTFPKTSIICKLK
jgi:hypothetical protein